MKKINEMPSTPEIITCGKHGSYEAYYQNGNLKISGKYRKDKQVGTWKAYDINENLIFKTRF